MAVWAEEGDIDAASTLTACRLPDEAASDASSAAGQQRCGRHQQAVQASVFGAPSGIIGGALFLGQDDLGFVEHRLFAPAAPP